MNRAVALRYAVRARAGEPQELQRLEGGTDSDGEPEPEEEGDKRASPRHA
jgi:hypothetical protein